MCKAMDEIIKESNEKVAAISKAEGKAEGLAEGEAKGLEEGEAKGEIKGEFKTYVQLVNDGDITLDRALEKLHMSLEEFYKKKAEFEKQES